ncbi:MAG: histidine decarboxylase [Pedosphaera sp.]|nr:histidine decarboxylase [Pedosphaera sp.]MSU43339.1 histidine decarboxylase [Pedosphaera sp.]
MPPALSDADRDRLDELHDLLQRKQRTFVGYPCTAGFDYSDLFRFLALPINNVGDPFGHSTIHLHTRAFEREVLDWFASLYHAPAGEWWGYVTNGGTEGNMYGLYLARELYPNGMVYYSQDTHYSVSKNLRMLRMQHIMLKSQPHGEMDYEDLRETLRLHRDVPPIIFANIGTTMREGHDDIARIQAILHDLAIPAYYIHGDAALCGMTLPFIAGAPVFDFRAGAHSLSVSGHKFIGSPIPCGVVLALKRNVDRVARSIEYVGTLDTTVTGSRNAFTPLVLWHALRTHGREGFARAVAGCLERAEYAVERFRQQGVAAWRNPNALTVVIPRPSQAVLEKWQIAVQDHIGHVIIMPHITRDQIDELAEDLGAHSS